MKQNIILGLELNFEEAKTPVELLGMALQLAIQEFLQNENILKDLEKGNYFYRDTLKNAMKPNASILKISHISLEIERYCKTNDDCEKNLLDLFIKHLKIGIIIASDKIHDIEKKKHGRKLPNRKNRGKKTDL